jgi:hypothetical protein
MRFRHGLILAIAFAASAIIASEANAYYEAMMGRFLTRDPAGEIGFRIGATSEADAYANFTAPRPWLSRDPSNEHRNLYEYVGSMPGSYTDPSGLLRNEGIGWPSWHDYWAYLKPWSGNEEIDPILGYPGDQIEGGAYYVTGGAVAGIGACYVFEFNPVLWGGPKPPRDHWRQIYKIIRPGEVNPGPPGIDTR